MPRLPLLLLACAALILYSLWILVISAAFFVVKVDNLSFLFVSIFDAARWPADVFRGWLRVVFTWLVPLAIILFGLAGMQIAMLPFRLFRWPRADTVVAGIEVTMRNMNLALLIKAVLFPENGPEELRELGAQMMFVILFYAAAAMGEGLPLALRFRRKARREEQRRTGDGHARADA